MQFLWFNLLDGGLSRETSLKNVVLHVVRFHFFLYDVYTALHDSVTELLAERGDGFMVSFGDCDVWHVPSIEA